ncbi:hypothetical protein NFI96_028663, partial [Prochilodus magdalenae]
CNCNPFGSESDHCNGTGFCKCKAGATGVKCHECQPGYLWDNGCKCLPPPPPLSPSPPPQKSVLA